MLLRPMANIWLFGDAPERRKSTVIARYDPFDMSDVELYDRYRFNRASLDFITDLVGESLVGAVDGRGWPTTKEQQVAVALRYMATGSFQRVVGDTVGISQSSACRALWRVVDALIEHKDRFIFMPTGDELRVEQNRFYDMHQFPNVVGCIDGTHIRIINPQSTFANSFINRKGYASINVMAVCDSRQRFRYVYAAWPGSSHDSFVLRQSNLWVNMEAGLCGGGTILGDSGYPCRNWLLTPIIDTTDDSQERYNDAHTLTRGIIERTFGQFKRRFAIMHQEVRTTPERACKLVLACTILHNLSKDFSLPEIGNDEDDDSDEEMFDYNTNRPPPNQAINQNAVRDAIIRNFF